MPTSGESGQSNNSAVKDSPLTAETHPSSSSLSGHRGTPREPQPHERVKRWLRREASSTPPPIDAGSYPSRPRGGLLYDHVSEKFVDTPKPTHATNDDEAKRRSRQIAEERPLQIDTSQQTWFRRGGDSSLSPSQEEILPPRPPSLPARPDNPYLNSRPSSTTRLAREKAKPATPTAQHQHQISSISTPDKPVSVRPSDERIDRIIQAQDRIFQALHLHNASAATTTPTYQQTSLPHVPSYPTVGNAQSYEPAMPGLPYPSGYTSPVSSSPIQSPYGHPPPVFRSQPTSSPPGRLPASYNHVDSFLADQGGRSWHHTHPSPPVQRWSSNDSGTGYISAPYPPADPGLTQRASPPGPSSMANVNPRKAFDPTAKEFIPSDRQADRTATGDPSAKGRGAVP